MHLIWYVSHAWKTYHIKCMYNIPYILESNPHPNLIRTNFCRFFKEKKKKKKKVSSRFSSAHFLQPPSEVARWVSAAWKAIPECIIVRFFKKCCIRNALDGSEDEILWEDDGEDEDDRMIVTRWRITIQLWVMTSSLMNTKLQILYNIYYK